MHFFTFHFVYLQFNSWCIYKKKIFRLGKQGGFQCSTIYFFATNFTLATGSNLTPRNHLSASHRICAFRQQLVLLTSCKTCMRGALENNFTAHPATSREAVSIYTYFSSNQWLSEGCQPVANSHFIQTGKLITRQRVSTLLLGSQIDVCSNAQ